MPNKKKNNAYHNKIVSVPSDDGWTHVIRGPAAVRLNQGDPKSYPTTSGSSKSQFKALPGYALAPSPLTTLEELHSERAKQRRLLEQSALTQALLHSLKTGLAELEHATGVSNAICIGLGSLSTSRRTTSMRQLVAFEMALEELKLHDRLSASAREEDGRAQVTIEEEPPVNQSNVATIPAADKEVTQSPSMPVYFQEIAFTSLDESFLASLGYSVLSVSASSLTFSAQSPSESLLGPAASHLKTTTFFYAPHLETDVIALAVAAMEPGPLFYMGTNMEAFDSRRPLARSVIEGISRSNKDSQAEVVNKDTELELTPNKRQNFGSWLESREEAFEAWIRRSRWYAPAEARRTSSEDANWASDFAFALQDNSREADVS